MKCYQHLRAKNDTNGNPRRLYVIYSLRDANSYALIEGVYDEGYSDRPAAARNIPELPTIQIEPKEYRRIVQYGKAKGVFHYS